MAKEIPEELKNYNKYPGEHVRVLPNHQIKIGEKSFLLVKEHKAGFDELALEQRYGHVFDKFDYIVGDWGHELLRLRGFYENHRKKVEAEEKISHLADYLQEYCAYGCAYFILQRQRAEGEVDKPFVADKEDLRMPKKPRQRKQDNPQKRKRETRNQGFSTVRPDGKTAEPKKKKSNDNNPVSKNKRKRKATPQKSDKKFVIRERKDK